MKDCRKGQYYVFSKTYPFSNPAPGIVHRFENEDLRLSFDIQLAESPNSGRHTLDIMALRLRLSILNPSCNRGPELDVSDSGHDELLR